MTAIRNNIEKKGQETMHEDKTLVGDFARKAEGAMDAAMDSAPAKALVSAVDSGLSTAGEWLGEVEDFFASTSKKATATVKKYPYQTVALGIGVGALFANLFHSSRKA